MWRSILGVEERPVLEKGPDFARLLEGGYQYSADRDRFRSLLLCPFASKANWALLRG